MKDQETARSLFYVLDYGLDEEQFRAILQGKTTLGRLDRDWAALRLLEYAPYPEIVRLLGFTALVENWPRWRTRITLEGRRRGIDFLTSWLVKDHPELCGRTQHE